MPDKPVCVTTSVMKDNSASLFRRFVRYYRPHRRLFALDLSTAFLRSGLMIILPLVAMKLIDQVELAQIKLSQIWLFIGAMTALIGLISFCEYINVKWGHILGTRIETAMRGDLFRHLQKLSFRYFDNTKTGHIMSRISNDLFTISELAHHGPEDLIISVILVTGSLIVMYLVNWQMAIIVTLPLPAILIWGSFFRMRLRRTFREVRLRVADINSNVENAIQGIRETQSYAQESYAIDQFDDVNDEFLSAKSNMYGTMARFHSVMMFLMEFYTVIIVGGGILLVHYGYLHLVEMIGFLMYRRYMFQPMRRLIGFMESYQQGVAAFERFAEVMDEVPDIEDRANAVSVTNVTGEIKFNNVYFRYEPDDEDWVLDNVDLHVSPGETIALVGESGAGKSTLATLIPRFYEVQSGSVTIDGHDVMDLKKQDLRQLVGIVQQDVFLFDATIRENIAFGKPEASDQELYHAAKRAHIYDYIMSLPEGFDSLVGERGVKLSGGQKQRVSIARVFLKNPPILIFDEATSSLDTESENVIQQSMEELCDGRTTVIIAHRLSTVRNSDFTYVLKNGQVVEKGKHEQLIANGGLYYDLYQRAAL